MNKILQMFSKYAVAFILVTVVCALIFVVAQQSMRHMANDPQIQIAEDGVTSLKDNDQRPLFSPETFDIEKSLGTFIGLYDKDGKVLESNATLDGQMPQPPTESFGKSKDKGRYFTTWQPKENVRQALVIMPIGNKGEEYLAVGRSLREIEQRTNQILQLIAIGWGILLIVTVGALIAMERKDKPAEVAPTDQSNSTPA